MLDPEATTASNVVVHSSYDPRNPPAHPGPQWTRFVCLSDTHSQRFAVPLGDVLLHSGDLSSFGTIKHLKATMDWIYQLPHAIKIIIAGNHDLALDTEWYENHWKQFHRRKENTRLATELMTGEVARGARVIYLEYLSVEIQAKKDGKKWKVYGSPGSPKFKGWAFNYERGHQAEDIHQCIPSDTDILLTHGPPHSILDMVHRGDHVGCKQLMRHLEVIRPVLHVFGHIHEDRGVKIQEWPSTEPTSSERSQTVFVNAANMPSGTKAQSLKNQGVIPRVGGPGFQPIIVDLFDPAPGGLGDIP